MQKKVNAGTKRRDETHEAKRKGSTGIRLKGKGRFCLSILSLRSLQGVQSSLDRGVRCPWFGWIATSLALLAMTGCGGGTGMEFSSVTSRNLTDSAL